MDYEKAYKDALERAEVIYQGSYKPDTAATIAETLQNIFPELKESGDERVKKDLIGFFKDEEFLYHKKEEIVEWLEKQGGKPQGKTALEAINEEKVDNANKVVVEPKFKTGDWIINRTDATIMQIVNNKDFYESIEIGGRRRTDTYNYVEWDFRLWSIEDAKDGDVLVDENNNIGIFEGIEGMCWHSYIYLGCNNRLYGFNIGGSHMQNNTKPATKEQRDLLFAKIKEAGYEWGAEKKELKIKLKEPDVYEYELERIVDKLNEVIGKLGDIYEVLSKPYVFPYRDYTPPSGVPGMDVWYKTHGVEKVTPVTCETLNSIETDNGKDNDKERTN